MADISTYLAQILSAVYGEDVRGSIHDAIEIINDVSEVVLTTGTAVTSASSSSEGFYDDSLYLNTNTYELWKCIGTDSWQSQGILKGNDGDPGDPGNLWYHGTTVSGKSTNPTIFPASGITDAQADDLYLNTSEQAIYHCGTGGDASTATWIYDFTIAGGGGSGDTVTWNQIITTGTQIATITINGTSVAVYAPTGGGGSYTGSKGVKLVGSDFQADLKSNTQGSLAAASKGSTADREYAVGLDSNGNLSVNIPWTDTTYESKAAASGGTAESLCTTGEKYDWSHKVDSSALDGWTAQAQADSSGTFVFDDLNNSYGYDLYCADALVGITGMTKGTGTNTGIKLTYTTNAASGTYGKLRILK